MTKREEDRKRGAYISCAKTTFFAVVVGLLIFYGARAAIKLADPNDEPPSGDGPFDETEGSKWNSSLTNDRARTFTSLHAPNFSVEASSKY
jgi:hypothetical protein